MGFLLPPSTPRKSTCLAAGPSPHGAISLLSPAVLLSCLGSSHCPGLLASWPHSRPAASTCRRCFCSAGRLHWPVGEADPLCAIFLSPEVSQRGMGSVHASLHSQDTRRCFSLKPYAFSGKANSLARARPWAQSFIPKGKRVLMKDSF